VITKAWQHNKLSDDILQVNGQGEVEQINGREGETATFSIGLLKREAARSIQDFAPLFSSGLVPV